MHARLRYALAESRGEGSHRLLDNWRAGASQPSRRTDTIFLYIYFYPARPHTDSGTSLTATEAA